MSETIAAVVLTYNRKNLLIECLNAIYNQTIQPDYLLIIDNNSTDGTADLLKENNYIPYNPVINENNDVVINHIKKTAESIERSLKIQYVLKHKNDGSAGGFNEGIKYAYLQGYNWIWVMDDDVEPAKNCLETILANTYDQRVKYDILLPDRYTNENLKNRWQYGTKFNFINPLYDISKGPGISFNSSDPLGILPIKCITFEGPLINRKVINAIGNVDKDLFIIHDDTDFSLRAINAGFNIGVVTEAIIYRKIYPKKGTGTKIDFKFYYQVRNNIIIDRRYGNNILAIIRYCRHSIKHLISILYFDYKNKKITVFKGILILLRGLIDGFRYKKDLTNNI